MNVQPLPLMYQVAWVYSGYKNAYDILSMRDFFSVIMLLGGLVVVVANFFGSQVLDFLNSENAEKFSPLYRYQCRPLSNGGALSGQAPVVASDSGHALTSQRAERTSGPHRNSLQCSHR